MLDIRYRYISFISNITSTRNLFRNITRNIQNRMNISTPYPIRAKHIQHGHIEQHAKPYFFILPNYTSAPIYRIFIGGIISQKDTFWLIQEITSPAGVFPQESQNKKATRNKRDGQVWRAALLLRFFNTCATLWAHNVFPHFTLLNGFQDSAHVPITEGLPLSKHTYMCVLML